MSDKDQVRSSQYRARISCFRGETTGSGPTGVPAKAWHPAHPFPRFWSLPGSARLVISAFLGERFPEVGFQTAVWIALSPGGQVSVDCVDRHRVGLGCAG